MTEKQLKKKILDSGRTLLFSNEDLKRLVIPLVIDQVLVRTVGMADTMMISSVGEAAISGVSLVDMINMLINAVFAAVATGGAVIASQYLGHRDREKACEASSQLMVVTAVCALVFTVLSLVARKPLLSLLFGRIDADVMDAALTYLTVSAISCPFLASFNSSSALFRAMNDSRTPTMVSLGMNVMNLVGNSILIFGMKWGVAGAAISTLLSRVMAAVVMFILSLNKHRQLYVRLDQMTRFQPTLVGQILYIGIPSGIENGIFELGRIVVVSMISTFGTVQIAANAVANTASTFLNIPANAVGMAALTVVGQCLGAGEKEQAVYYSRRLLLTAYCGAWVMNLSAFLFANRFVISLFNLSPEAQTMALQVMVWFNFVSLFFWPSSFTLPNILRAAGDARFTMAVSILSMWVFRVGFCYVMVLGFHGRLLSIWMGMFLDWVFRSLCFFVRFARGRWMEQSVI